MSDPQSHERTQRLDPARSEPAPDRTAAMPGGTSAPISYTEEYSDQAVEQTMVDPGVLGAAGPRPPLQEGEPERRSWGTTSLVFTGIISLLVGMILALLLLPEEDPTIAVDDAAAQQALADASDQAAELADGVRALQAENAELRAELDARQAELDAANAEAEGDDAAAEQAAADRQTALAEREAALNDREAALNDRDAELAEREAAMDDREDAVASDGGGGGITLPDLDGIDLPVELPQINEEQARGVFERLIDRLQGLFGGSE